MAYRNILQVMIPPAGWEAVFAEHKKSPEKFYTRPLSCLALVEFRVIPNSPFSTVVVGMVQDEVEAGKLDFVDNAGKFLGYNYPGCKVEWHGEAIRFQKLGEI